MLAVPTRVAVAWLALLGFAFGLGAPVIDADHGGRSDAEARFGMSAHLVEHDVPHLGASADAPGDDHCALCHWGRSLGQAGPGRPLAAAADTASASARSSLGPRVAGTDLSVGGDRGPPALARPS